MAQMFKPAVGHWLPTAGFEQQWAVGQTAQALHETLTAGQQIAFRPELTRLEAIDVFEADCLCIPVTVERSAFLGFAYLMHVQGTQARFRCLARKPSTVGERQMLVVPQCAWLRI